MADESKRKPHDTTNRGRSRWSEELPDATQVATQIMKMVTDCSQSLQIYQDWNHDTVISIFVNGQKKKIIDCQPSPAQLAARRTSKLTYLHVYPASVTKDQWIQNWVARLGEGKVGSYQQSAKRLRISLEEPASVNRHHDLLKSMLTEFMIEVDKQLD